MPAQQLVGGQVKGDDQSAGQKLDSMAHNTISMIRQETISRLDQRRDVEVQAAFWLQAHLTARGRNLGLQLGFFG